MSPTSKAIFLGAPTPADSQLGVSLTPHSPSHLSAISLGFSTESIFSNSNVNDSWSSFLVFWVSLCTCPEGSCPLFSFSYQPPVCWPHLLFHLCLLLFLTALYCLMFSWTGPARCSSGTSVATCLALTHHRCPNPYHPSPISSHFTASPSTQVPRPQASETSSQACLSLSLHVAPVIGSSILQSHYLLHPYHHVLA